MRRVWLRVFDAFLFGIVLSTVLGLPSIVWEASGSSVGNALATAFMTPGGVLMKPFHYSAFAAFKQFTHSDGPGAAYLQMLMLSHITWTVVFALAFYLCVRHLQQSRLGHH